TAVAHGPAYTALTVAGSVLLDLGLFLLAFMVLTAEPLRPRDVAVGVITATLFWETLQLIGTWFVGRGLRHASPTYGVFAVIITLLSWLYLGSRLPWLAAEITVVLRSRLCPRPIPQPPLPRAAGLTLARLARMETRRPEEVVSPPFTGAADEDPLRGLP